MTFDFPKEGSRYLEHEQELYWTSRPKDEKASIKIVVHPGLKHGGKLMNKPKVFVA